VFRAVAISIVAVPSYVLFALLLMYVSAVTVRVLNWRTPPNAEMRIADVDWPLLQWARSLAATHIVRVFAGLLFRGSPIWTAYLRLAGARLGRRVYVNSLAVTDYNLLEFGLAATLRLGSGASSRSASKLVTDARLAHGALCPSTLGSKRSRPTPAFLPNGLRNQAHTVAGASTVPI
jgi:hypothetical protein